VDADAAIHHSVARPKQHHDDIVGIDATYHRHIPVHLVRREQGGQWCSGDSFIGGHRRPSSRR
jgi:hypothetical protein